MRRLGIAVAVLALLGGGLDVAARSFAEGQLEDRIRRYDPAVEDPEVTISSLPFLGRLLLTGEVPELRAEVAELDAGPLAFSSIVVELRGVRINRNLLVSQRQVELESIDEGIVEASVTTGALTRAIGVPVDLAGGRVDLRVEDRVLVVGVAGRTFRVPVPDAPLLPCVSSATFEEDRVVLRCTVDEIPPELVRAASRAVNRG